MKILVAVVFYFLYWGVCFLMTGTDRKNLSGLRSYPEEVQTVYPRQDCTAQNAAAIPCRQVLGAYMVAFDRS